MTDEQIVNQLNQEGLITNKGRKFTVSGVQWIRFKHRIPALCLQKPGELSINQVAEKFNVSHYVVRYWIKHKMIHVRRIGSKVWIPMDLEQEHELRKLADSSPKIAIARLQAQKQIERGVL